jgi:anti-sigma B factor antagonist
MAFTAKQQANGVTVVTVNGQLIVANRLELKQVVDEALERGERKFLMDFTPTAYIDSSGLGALVSINKKVREAGGVLRLAGLNDDLASLFELTKLDTLFNIAETLPEALKAF